MRSPNGVAIVAALVALGGTSLAGKAPSMEIAVAEGSFTDDPQGSPRREAAFQWAQGLGATHIRAFLPFVKTASGTYDDTYLYFPAFDSFVDEANAKGFQVQLSLMGIAAEKFAGPDRTGVDPDPKLYQQFVAACVRHFGKRVLRYSIWNEPNNPVFLMPTPRTLGIAGALGGTTPTPQEIAAANAKKYRELYDEGYHTIKEIEPDAQVLVGELSSSHDPREFVNLLAPEGTTLVADGFALHPYQFAVSPLAKEEGPGTGCGISRVKEFQAFLEKLASQKRLVTANGGKLPLYLTEFGYQKKEGRVFQEPSVQIPESERALWLPEAFQVAQEDGARQMLYFQLLPTPPDYGWDTSIIDSNNVPLPSYAALQKWAKSEGYATH